MAVHSVTAVGVHLGTLRNVDLPRRGLYHVRCGLHSERSDGGLARGVPHVLPPEMPCDHRAMLPSAVLEGEMAFQTRSVDVCYQAEEAALDDVVQFWVEEACGTGEAAEADLLLVLRLMYADISTWAPTESPEADLRAKQDAAAGLVSSDWEQVCVKTLRLHGASRGAHTYCPCDFGTYNFFCRLDVMVHSSLLDFRVRIPRPLTGARLRQPSTYEALVSLGSWIESRASRRQRAEGGLCGLQGRSEAEDGCGAGLEPLMPEDLKRLKASADCIQRECACRLAEACKSLLLFVESIASHQETSQVTPPPTSASSGQLTPRDGVGRKAHFAATRRAIMELRRGAPGECSLDAGAADEPLGPISARPGSESAAGAAALLAGDLVGLSARVAAAWRLLWEVAAHASADVRDMLRKAWEAEEVDCWNGHIVRKVRCSGRICEGLVEDGRTTPRGGPTPAATPEPQRGSVPRPVQDADIPLLQPHLPVLLEETYARSEALVLGQQQAAKPLAGKGLACGVHVVVLVHGFQGNSWDMMLLKSYLSLQFPKSLYLCSTANEDNSEADIEDMGARLAREVVTFLRERCPHTPAFDSLGVPAAAAARQPHCPDSARGLCLGRLSFVCHSVGGLIARAALPLLKHTYGSRFFTFMSLSCPHLGYLYGPTAAFKTGLWVARKLWQSRCLEQLSMTDASCPQDCCLARLARLPGLELFQHVVLIGSLQDEYAPFRSARLEMTSAARQDSRFGPVYAEMVQSLLGPLEPERLLRLSVSFNLTESSLDTVIGRAAHVQFLESRALMSMLTHMYSRLFE